MKQQSYMDLERLLTLVFSNPDNISIQYSNINGEEKLIVNGENLMSLGEDYDDSQIKEYVRLYKEKIEKLDDYIFEKVIDAADKHHFNLFEMNKGLELEHYTEEDALLANNTITLMTEVIRTVLKQEIQNLKDILELF